MLTKSKALCYRSEGCTSRTGTNERREAALGPLDLLGMNLNTNTFDQPLFLYSQHYPLPELASFHRITRKKVGCRSLLWVARHVRLSYSQE